MWIEWTDDTVVTLWKDSHPAKITMSKGERSELSSIQDSPHPTKKESSIIQFVDGGITTVDRSNFRRIYLFTLKVSHILVIPTTKEIWAPNENQAIQMLEETKMPDVFECIAESYECRVTAIEEKKD